MGRKPTTVNIFNRLIGFRWLKLAWTLLALWLTYLAYKWTGWRWWNLDMIQLIDRLDRMKLLNYRSQIWLRYWKTELLD